MWCDACDFGEFFDANTELAGAITVVLFYEVVLDVILDGAMLDDFVPPTEQERDDLMVGRGFHGVIVGKGNAVLEESIRLAAEAL